MYGTIEKFKDYCIANDYDIAAFSDTAISAKLNRAQMRIDSRFHGKFVGQREKVQAFEFPRTGAVYPYAYGKYSRYFLFNHGRSGLSLRLREIL